MIKKLFFGLVSVFLAALIIQSCSTARFARLEKDKIIARVNDQEVPLLTLQEKLEELGYHSTSPQEDMEKKETALNEIIADFIVKQRARAMDLSNDQTFQKNRAEHMDEFLLNLLYEKELVDKIEVTFEEADIFYQENPYEFYRIPDKAKLSRIMIIIQAHPQAVDYPEEEQKALDKILTIRQRIIDGEDFARLAEEFSEDKRSAAKGGDEGFVLRGTLVPEFEDFIFSADLNQLSQPIKSPQGYNLLMVQERKQGEKRELNDELRERIRDHLKKEKEGQKAAEYINELKENASFVFNQDVLSQADSLVTDDPWVMIINQQDTVRHDYYHSFWEGYASGADEDTISLEHRKDFLKGLLVVARSLLRQDAKAKGYLDHPEYLEEEASYTLTMAVEKMKSGPALEVKAYRPTEREVYEFYLAHREDYPTDSSIHVYHILFQDSALAQKVRKDILSGADFAEMAEKYHSGTGPQGITSYDLGFISDQMVSENFYKTAILLQVGQVSQLVETERGYHLIKLVDRIKGLLDPYKPGIGNRLRQSKVNEVKERWERKLREESDIWIDQTLLRKIKLKKT